MDFSIVLGGVITPFIVSFVKNARWDRRVKVLVSVVVAFLVTSANLALGGEFTNWGDYLQDVGSTWAIAQAWYQVHFGDTGTNASLEKMLYE